jgi:TetR/AcrR family transcriptional repressor of nem operon
MPRVTQHQTEQNRRAIEKASSRLFRAKGLDGVSVAEVMAAAGLTHGGFYGHFSSKNELAATACTRAFLDSGARWERRFSELPDPAARRRAYVESYLATATRDRPGGGCAAAALATDVARAQDGAPVRAAFVQGLHAMVARLVQLQPEGSADPAVAEQQALADMATLVGALVLARAVKGDPLSEALLDGARARLLAGTQA